MWEKKHIFVLEGGLGVGKSTVLRILKDRAPDFVVLEEAVDELTNFLGINMLRAFRDAKIGLKPAGEAVFELQLFVLRMLLHRYAQVDKSDGKIFVLERGINSALAGFLPVNQGLMTSRQYDVIVALYEAAFDLLEAKTHVVLLTAPPGDMLDRVRKRNREEERGLSDDYLLKLQKNFEELGLLPGREQGYTEWTFESAGKTPQEVAEKLERYIRNKVKEEEEGEEGSPCPKELDGVAGSDGGGERPKVSGAPAASREEDDQAIESGPATGDSIHTKGIAPTKSASSLKSAKIGAGLRTLVEQAIAGDGSGEEDKPRGSSAMVKAATMHAYRKVD